MRFFDLHCDTLYRCVEEGQNLNKNNFHVSLDKTKNFDKYIGCFAAWISDEYRGNSAFELFNRMYNKLRESCGDAFKICKDKETLDSIKRGAILTVENGAALGGDISNLEFLYDCGVRVMTLTWNGSNEIGDGIGVKRAKGITEFGRKVVKLMEDKGMVVDVSHSSERLFYDVASMARKPFIATHSNARKVCSHERNLTDEQISTINKVGGIIGVNFCDKFLRDGGNADVSDILRHIEYFLSRGCEESLCIGSDFDGTDMPNGVTGIESIEKVYEYCLKHNYSQELVNKIFYKNANEFFCRVM